MPNHIARLDDWVTGIHLVTGLPPLPPQPDFYYDPPNGSDRMIIVMLGMELNNQPDAHIIQATYGRQPMIKLAHDMINTIYGSYSGQGYSEIWGIDEKGIRDAADNTIHVNYGTIGYTHVTLAHAIATFKNIDQLNPVIDFASDKCGGSDPTVPLPYPSLYCDRPLHATVRTEPGAMIVANAWSGHECNTWEWRCITKRYGPEINDLCALGDSMGGADSSIGDKAPFESSIEDSELHTITAIVNKLTIRQVMVALTLRPVATQPLEMALRTRQIPTGNPHRFVELYGGTVVETLFYEPDPFTFRADYYYNTRTNQLKKKIKVGKAPFWKTINYIGKD